MDLPMDMEKIKKVMDTVMNTPEGKKLAEGLKASLQALGEKFQELSEEDKQRFVNDFKGKFSKSFEGIKEKLGQQNGEDGGGSPFGGAPFASMFPAPLGLQPNYFLFLFAFLFVVLLLGFFGYKLYKSIMEKEQKGKKNKKESKKEKKVNSPPASPRSKKEK